MVDIETTGLSRYFHRITEIAAVRSVDGRAVEEFQTLVNPGTHIPSFITHLTGIDDRMVKDAPSIKEALPGFISFLDADVMVAHNATFDHGFLSHNHYLTTGKHIDNDVLCTRRLSRRLLPDVYSTRLGVVCEHLGINNMQAHRALGDARATTHVLHKLLDHLKQREITQTKDIIKFSKTSVAKCQAQEQRQDRVAAQTP